MHFRNVFAVLLCGWSAQSHYSVRRPCHLSWKRFTGHNLQRKGFFLSSFRNKKATYLKNHELSLQFPWLSVACMYRGAGMLLARYRPLSAWGERKKAKEHLLLTFSFYICLNPVVGTGSDIRDWNQRKNFHFHIPNRFHIKPLFCKTLPTYNCNPPTRNFTLSRHKKRLKRILLEVGYSRPFGPMFTLGLNKVLASVWRL